MIALIPSLLLYTSIFLSIFFEIVLLITYLEVREEVKFEEKYAGKDVRVFPSTTIIVPCWNEEGTVIPTVKSILNLDYPKDKLNVILVDDGSTDNTRKELNKFKNHPQVMIYSKENGGKHTALNFALDKIHTELVGCLDADSFVNADALRKIVPYFADPLIAAVTPGVKIHEPKSVLQHLQRIEYNWGIFFRRLLSSLGAIYVTPGPFSIFRTEVLKDVGGYKYAHKPEDLEMALRLQKNRYKIGNAAGAHVYTVAPARFPELYKQRVRWTYGFLNNAFDYREMFFNRKYGNVGVFILPMAIVSIFSTIFGSTNLVWGGVARAFDGVERFNAMGFNWRPHMPSFDWFFLNTSIMTLLALFAVMMSIAIIMLSMRMSEGRAKVTRGVIYYLVLYIFLAPTWLIKAIWSTLWRKDVVWR